MDFKHDLAKLVGKMMTKAGIKISAAWNECYTCIKYFELYQRKFDSSIPYMVVFSRELQNKIPLLSRSDQDALQDIVYRIENRLSITSYMSKNINKTAVKKSDFLLKNWGIYHLHLEKNIPRIKYTNPNLLFFLCTGQVVHMIDIKTHPIGREWFDRKLLEIIDDNWPWLLCYYPGAKSSGLIKDSQVHNSLKHSMVSITFRGRVLVPTTLGTASSGDSNLAVQHAFRILNELKKWESTLKEKEEILRKEIYESTSIVVKEPLDYTLILEDGFFVAYENHSHAKIKLFADKAFKNE